MSSNLFQAWLDRVCAMLPGVRSAAFVVAGKEAALCHWPHDRPAPEALVAAARLAAQRGAPVDSPVEEGAGDSVVAQPVKIGDRMLGGIALAVPAGADRQAVVHQLLDWSEAWLELLLRKRAPASSGDDGALTRFVAGLPAAEGLQVLATAVLDRLTERITADGGWFGVIESGRPVVVACTRAVGDGAALDGMVEEAMLEAEARHGVVRFTLGGSNAPEFAAHAVLAREGGCPFLLTVPLELDPDLSVIVLLERAGPRAFGSRDEAELEGILDRLLPLLRLERALRPGPLARAERTGVAVLERLSERGATRPRLALAAVAAVALVLALGRGEHEIRADAFVEGRVQQAIAAPFEGYVAEASVRAGERVEAGQLVARLEDEDLRLEQQQIDNELAALDREYRQALAAIDQAQTRILQARIAQANARRGLLEGRLAQVELKAPVDGVVISGDLSRAVGTPVTKGQLLFEIAPLDAYRVVARIPEADIDELAEGQSGELLLSAFPGKPIPFVVERVSSVFDDALQTDVVFRVEGSLEGAAEADLVRLRPGMAGVARIDAGSRSLWWIYTHELGDWLRLVAWRWLP